MSICPQMSKIVIKNFGCIGPEPVELEIDKIVVLVGANNTGKSTILRAIEVITDGLKLEEDDFHNREVSPENFPVIELHSIANDENENKPGDEWCEKLPNGGYLVKEKWTWQGTKKDPERIGYNIELGRWAEKDDKELVPWGATNKAKGKRPKPHRVSTFDPPEIQSIAISELLKDYLKQKIQAYKDKEDSEKPNYEILIEELTDLKTKVKENQKKAVGEIKNDANQMIGKIFPDQELNFVENDDEKEIKIELLGEEYSIEMGPIGGVSFPIHKQGSGTRRTILWTVLKLLADRGIKAKERKTKTSKAHESVGASKAHILLLDEPELSLHPSAIQDARDVLYSLPNNDNWQVIVTTHSPSFVDLTKDNTTIIRVEKDNKDIKATTLFKPEKAKLTNDDKENLKLRNLFDSHISEAFFGGKILVVEGDTEYSAFNYIKQKELESGNEQFNNVNIIRARGKVTVASMMKVLNHFKNKYYVLHDTDTKKVLSKRKNKEKSKDGVVVYDTFEMTNPAWTNNEKIQNEMSDKSSVFASIINFEEAYFTETVGNDKPENCINQIKESTEYYGIIKNMFEVVLDINGEDIPNGLIQWSSLDQIDKAVDDWREKNVTN